MTEWYRSGGTRGRPLEDQALIELAFALGKMPDELEASDPVWLNKMLAALNARIAAGKR